ncbi:MAG: DUF4126 domain-containing protein [Leptospiraceae bacterium]|nr:DUF4126 domain-containing protein [Leptospiraceae bacterium]
MTLEFLQAFILGVSLAAACGFRVFVPPFIVSVAALLNWIPMADSFAWLDTPEAAIALGLATIIEVIAYYIPWLDNLLDILATPVALVAGTIMLAAQLTELDPVWTWSIAAIVGGGSAGIVQILTVLFRTLSSTLTGGLGNPFISTAEGFLSLASGVLAIVSPYIALILLLSIIFLIGNRVLNRRKLLRDQ